MMALVFGSPLPASTSVSRCEAAIAGGELRVLKPDWEAVREQFSQEERAQIQARITITIEAPSPGWYLSLRRLDPQLTRRLVYTLYTTVGLREVGE